MTQVFAAYVKYLQSEAAVAFVRTRGDQSPCIENFALGNVSGLDLTRTLAPEAKLLHD